MKIRKKSQSRDFLDVKNNFSVLLDVEGDADYVYEFEYGVAASKSLDIGANILSISTYKTPPIIDPDLFSSLGNPNSIDSLPNQILTYSGRRKDKTSSAELKSISSVLDDISRSVNNNESSNLKNPNNTNKKRKVIGLATLSKLTEKNYDPPSVQISPLVKGLDNTNSDSIASDGLFLISHGIDPSVLAKKSKHIVSTLNSLGGINTLSTAEGYTSDSMSPLDASKRKIQESYVGPGAQEIDPLSDLTENTLVPYVAEVTTIFTRLKKVMRIPQAQVGSGDFWVVFELRDNNQQLIQRVIKKCLHSRLLKIFNTPKIEPTIKIANFQLLGKNTLELTQNDPRATNMRIERRAIKHNDLELIDKNYKLIATIPITKKDGLIKFIDIINNSSNIQYRCIPVGPGGVVGSIFDNAVSPAVKYGTDNISYSRKNTAVALDIGNIQGAVEIAVTNVPVGVVSIAILRKEVHVDTTFKTLSVLKPISLVTKGLSRTRYQDTDVKRKRIYEYSCRLFYKDGTEAKSLSSVIHRYENLEKEKAIANISDLRVFRTGKDIDVSFNVRSSVLENNLDAVKAAIERQGLGDLFTNDLEKERDQLQKLIAHHITRVNLTTGEYENFGTITEESFSDRRFGSIRGVAPIKDGRKYRYIVSTLLRDADTMFGDLKKNAVDSATGKEYEYSPFKFRHPLALTEGTIVDRQTLETNHPEDDFSFGRIGNSREIDVNIELTNPKILDLAATRESENAIILTWQIDGAKNRIEHFVVIKEILGQRFIAGRAHHISKGGIYEFFDNLTHDDIGEISYSIIPIYNDFSQGSVSPHVSVIVEDRRIS